jgi:hypothetical protein
VADELLVVSRAVSTGLCHDCLEADLKCAESLGFEHSLELPTTPTIVAVVRAATPAPSTMALRACGIFTANARLRFSEALGVERRKPWRFSIT